MRMYFYFFLFVPSVSLSFQTSFADSMAKEARLLPPEKGIIFMLDNFYSVFNKNYDDGLKWGEQTLVQAKKFGNEQLIGRSHLRLGTIWYLKGDYEKSIKNYQSAQSIFEEIGDKCYLGKTHNELSVYSRKQKQFDKSLEHLDLSFELCKNCDDKACLETSLNNRGVVYEMMGQYQKAIEYYNRAKQIAIQSGNEIGLSYIYNNLAECYRLMERPDSVILNIEKSTEIRKRLEDEQGVTINYANLGEFLTLEREFDKAEHYLSLALVKSREIKYIDLERHINYLFFDLFNAQNQSDKAKNFLERSLFLKDSLLNLEKIKSLSEMEVKYDTEKIEREYEEEQRLRVESELKVANRNIFIIGLAGATLTLFFLGLFFYQRKMKIAQAEKNEAILAEKQKGLEAVFGATEKERQRIAKDLHDGIGQQMSGLKLAWENLSISIEATEPDKAEKLKQLGLILNETAEEVREISHQMMPRVLGEFGLIPAITEMLDKALKLSKVKFEFEHFNIEDRFTTKVELSIFRIAQELINNVIKHSGATFVSIQLFKNKEQLILIVEDNGSGFNSAENDGHGLLNIKSRLNTISGYVNYEASSQKGTMATIRIDLSKNKHN